MDEGTRMRSGKNRNGDIFDGLIFTRNTTLDTGQAYSNELCAKVNASDALPGTAYLFLMDLVLQER